jgi:Mrp family chromosome partitioning ATPase
MDFQAEQSVLKQSQAEASGSRSIGSANRTSYNAENPLRSRRRGIPEFSELLIACRHHLLLTALLGVLISSVLAVGAWLLIEAPFEATSLVRVRQHPDHVLTQRTTRADDADFVRAQEQLVLSPQVLAAALANESIGPMAPAGPRHETIEWLRSMLKINIQSGAEVLSISTRNTSADASQAISAAVTLAYLDEVTNRATADRRQRQIKLEQAARDADRKLDELWSKLNAIATQVGSDSSQSLTIRDEIQLQAYRDYARQLRAAQLRGNELRSLLTDEQLRVDNAGDAVDDITEQLLQSHPDVAAMRDRIASADAKIKQMREIVADNTSPRLKRLMDDRLFFRADLERGINDLRPKLRERSQEQNRINLEGGLAQLKRQIELNESEKEFLHSRMAEIDTSIVRTNINNGVQLEMSRHAVDRQTRLADSLWRSLEEFKIEGQSQPRITLIELAQLPSKANHSRQMKAAAAMAGIGWLMVLLGVGLFEWRSCRVRDFDDIISCSTRPVFGVSSIPDGLGPNGQPNPSVGANEVAAKLMMLNKGHQSISTLMVASLADGEPHQLVSLDLARVFRAFGRRTLLVDCEISRPSLSRELSAEHLFGVLQICQGQAEPHACIIPSSERDLDFMPAGQVQGASPWIDPQSFQRLLKFLRRDYDAIVINGPTLMSSAANLLLASHVEQTVFAVFSGISRWDQLADNEHVAIQAGIPIFGSVMRSPTAAARLALQFDRQGTSRARKVEPTSEEDLRETVTAIRQDLHEAGSHTPESKTRHESYKKISS